MPEEVRPALPTVTPPGGGASGAIGTNADTAPPTATARADDAPGPMHGRVDRGRRWVLAKRVWAESLLLERRKRGGIVAAGYDVQGLDADVGGGILAGAVAFRMFLFMVPFVYVVFTVLGLIADSTNQNPDQLARTVGITGVLASAVVSTQDQSAWTQLILVTGATIALFITARSLVKTLFVVNWLIWRTPRVKPTGQRPILLLISLALVLTVFGLVLNELRRAAGVSGAVLMVFLVSVAAFALWWWVSSLLPHAPVPARALVPGAVLWAIGLNVLHLLTTFWIGPLVARKSNTYGAVGIALAVLFWVYVLGRIIVGSAGLNATLWRRQQEHSGSVTVDSTSSAPSP
jgi:uncharacterized BrkB/YihY/UPF0761 family membrane protein